MFSICFQRLWLLLEIAYFFSWISALILFIFLAFIFKLQTFSKDEDTLLMDDDVWNDKDTVDYLKYVKLETYFICYNLSFLFMDI